MRAIPVIVSGVVVSCAALASGARSGETLLERIEAERMPPDPRYDRLAGWTAPGRPTVALALSGGGARGLAHLGVLREMREDGVPFDAIAGTSIGALIGAFVSAGYEAREVERILVEKDWDVIISGLDVRRRTLSRSEELYRYAQLSFRFPRDRRLQVGALAQSGRLERELYRYLLRAQLECSGEFDRLLYRYRPVATDILTGRRVAPAGGDLVAAVRGSSALPGVFPPVPYDGGHLLVDGGLVENIPVETARSFETDLVLAVSVSESVSPSVGVRSAADVLARSLLVVTAQRDAELLAQSDLTISPAVFGLPRGSFRAHADEMMDAGRVAYLERRDELWRLLESVAADVARIEYDRIEVRGSGWITPIELVGRLGGAPGAVTRFRVAAELARALNLGPFADGHVEWLRTGSERVLRFVLVENPPIRTVQARLASAPALRLPAATPSGPFGTVAARDLYWAARRQLLERGHVLVRLDALSWDPATGNLSLRLVEPSVRTIDAAVQGEVRLERIRRFFWDLRGEAFTFDRLADRLDELVARGALFDWSLSPRAAPDDQVDVVARVWGDEHLEVAAGASFRSTLGFHAFVRGAKSNFTGRGDFVDVVVAGSRDRSYVAGRYRTEYGVGFRNVGGELGASYFDNSFLVIDRDQELVEDAEEDYSGERVWLSLFRRLRLGAVVQASVFRERNRFEETLGRPAATHERTSAAIAFDLNRHERLLFPERGFALELRAESSLDEDELWKAELQADVAVPLGPARRHVMTTRFSVGLSDDADLRPFWFEPGGYRRLYGFVPYGSAAPQYARGGLTWRYRWLDLNLARFYVETGADWITTSTERQTLDARGGALGYGVSVTAYSRFLGPVTVGAARNDRGADLLFVTVGFPFGD